MSYPIKDAHHQEIHHQNYNRYVMKHTVVITLPNPSNVIMTGIDSYTSSTVSLNTGWWRLPESRRGAAK